MRETGRAEKRTKIEKMIVQKDKTKGEKLGEKRWGSRPKDCPARRKDWNPQLKQVHGLEC